MRYHVYYRAVPYCGRVAVNTLWPCSAEMSDGYKDSFRWTFRSRNIDGAYASADLGVILSACCHLANFPQSGDDLNKNG